MSFEPAYAYDPKCYIYCSRCANDLLVDKALGKWEIYQKFGWYYVDGGWRCRRCENGWIRCKLEFKESDFGQGRWTEPEWEAAVLKRMIPPSNVGVIERNELIAGLIADRLKGEPVVPNCSPVFEFLLDGSRLIKKGAKDE